MRSSREAILRLNKVLKSFGPFLFLLLAIPVTVESRENMPGVRQCGTHRAIGEFLFDGKQPVLKIYNFTPRETVLRLRGDSLSNASRLFGQIVVLTGDIIRFEDELHGEMEVTSIEKIPPTAELLKDRKGTEGLSLIGAKRCRRAER